ncbi:MAG: hypothetical protein HEQ27_15725 [Dolichospermum sp. JUN01]|jgi:hypothetical protein|nr:hypothetical protein [Dolichospermum sp. JUN01]
MSVENQTALQGKDYLADNAINNGTKKVEEETKEPQYITLTYTNSEIEKIRELTSVLRLSKELFLETAISYLHFCFFEQKESIEKIINEESEKYKAESKQISVVDNMPKKEIDRLSGKIKLSPEISNKVEELNMRDKINECLFIGINLLYKQLIGDLKTVNEEK